MGNTFTFKTMDATVVMAFLALVVYGAAVGYFCYNSRIRWSHKGPRWMNARQRRRRSLKQMA